MLLTVDQIEHILDLHELTYELFGWLKDSLNSGGLEFRVIHHATDSSANAVDWIERHRGSIPSSIAGRISEIRPVANLLISYLSTSFELKVKPKVVTDGRQCGCGWCGWATKLNYLVPRHPTDKDYRTANELKQLHVADLAKSLGVAWTTDKAELFARNESLGVEVAHVTYLRELWRRTEFASQGPAVLALWRTIAWKDHRLIPKYRLTVARVLDAQEIVTAVLSSSRRPTSV